MHVTTGLCSLLGAGTLQSLANYRKLSLQRRCRQEDIGQRDGTVPDAAGHYGTCEERKPNGISSLNVVFASFITAYNRPTDQAAVNGARTQQGLIVRVAASAAAQGVRSSQTPVNWSSPT